MYLHSRAQLESTFFLFLIPQALSEAEISGREQGKTIILPLFSNWRAKFIHGLGNVGSIAVAFVQQSTALSNSCMSKY